MTEGVRPRHALMESDRERIRQSDISQQLRLDDVCAPAHDVLEYDLFDGALIRIAQPTI